MPTNTAFADGFGIGSCVGHACRCRTSNTREKAKASCFWKEAVDRLDGRMDVPPPSRPSKRRSIWSWSMYASLEKKSKASSNCRLGPVRENPSFSSGKNAAQSDYVQCWTHVPFFHSNSSRRWQRDCRRTMRADHSLQHWAAPRFSWSRYSAHGRCCPPAFVTGAGLAPAGP